ncbi:GNAT family N-acetyltransferase [candidate division KSB3 bacterium]|uniref:GNAT family N-acetyltransferase n=1 Tax=candidate division KSB3 bacterium TaxID=2044937 RepID=A0A9D5JW49_9BACT|nr:GNAT family N-acetyltransferase [candidate division KSB3 bacterium]MBD3325343.1 GNAT family N-acetyltransferase [candidate division KSB3 bacterium]
MQIRTAARSDLSSLVAIYNQAVEAGQRTADIDPVTVEERQPWFEAHSPDKYPLLVAERDGKVLGYATLSPYRPGRRAMRFTAEISYYVDFASHRQGIASRLVQHALDLCPALRIKTVFAIILDTNTASIRLLQTFGFRQWGHLPRVADFDGVEVGHVYYGLRIGGTEEER